MSIHFKEGVSLIDMPVTDWTGDQIKTIPHLMVIGDALRDTYLIGEWVDRPGNQRFKPQERLVFVGGAANTTLNALAILNDSPKGVQARVIGWMNDRPLELLRLADKHQTIETYLEPVGHESLTLPPTTYAKVTGIIISDYNKGTVNSARPQRAPSADWLIVDSRYRSVHPSWLESAPIKIWRCTGDEFDHEWAKQFDYVVHTNGAAKISLYAYREGQQHLLHRCEAPIIDPVDTCGAGDTFTAALASYLLLGRGRCPMYLMEKITPEEAARRDLLRSAIPFCIEAAQDVCMKPYTAVTSKRL